MATASQVQRWQSEVAKRRAELFGGDTAKPNLSKDHKYKPPLKPALPIPVEDIFGEDPDTLLDDNAE